MYKFLMISFFAVAFSVPFFAQAQGECGILCERRQEANARFSASLCGGGGSTCALAHMSFAERAKATQWANRYQGGSVFNDLESSQNPDFTLERYIEIEKDYASRGEPLNADNLIKFMHHLYKNPTSKCGFDSMSGSKGSYGLVCEGGGTKAEFPGLTATLLNEKFVAYSKNPPVVERVAEPLPPIVETVQPEVNDPPVVGDVDDNIHVADAPVTSMEPEVRTIIPSSLNDGVQFSEESDSVLPDNRERLPSSYGVR